MLEDRLLEPAEVAGLIGMRVDYVYAMCRRGEIPHQRFGRYIRFRASSIERWLEERESGSIGVD